MVISERRLKILNNRSLTGLIAEEDSLHIDTCFLYPEIFVWAFFFI